MKFTLENQYLNGVVELMQRMPLAGYQSMARTRFIRVLKNPVQELADANKDLLNEFGQKDSDGEPVIEDGNYKLKPDKIQAYRDSYEKLMNESAEIDKGTYTRHKEDVQDILKHCDLKLSGNEATIYAALCDALDVNFDEKEGK
ncbi:hypothetical protein LFAB_05300 [Lactiplantibacillus fabifermentans T30PCM01]|uniref:DUF1617 family protein n=1 Tax=Lactiplantibacillus fabifermentans T30PCM01 TaxID=1400520 RepID=W6TCQ1_9LACO|nr:DUF1617 family protein [Lactiplantibacillus fabifermentans]ETY74780.1 hypothetical protein LFAB_05300 [Lactiplantibacillus fabifermentans T30PCM01]